ncbi:MAG TPA: hypothetical protein VE953_13840 [Terriglobales bacterium]|nr:hypothetical protein [Terriglobales bacterium]
MSDPVRLRFVVAVPDRFLPFLVRRGLFWFAMTALVAPALWILIGFATDASDAGRRLEACSFGFGFAAALAWRSWHIAYEVTVERDELRWRGFPGRGRAPLSRLRRVREPTLGRNQVEFDLGPLRSFTVSPAAGLAEFVERLMAAEPYLQVQLPPSVWRDAHRHRGHFEEVKG